MKKLTYQYAEQMAESEESPILTLVECSCNDEDFEALYSQIQSIAYNGEVTVDDDGEPEPPPTTEQRVSDLEEQLAQSDETAIALYEAQEAQEAINVQQDEALMELYEMKY